MINWQGRKVLIIGIARQGIALAKYLVLHGAAVTLNDKRPLRDLVEARQALANLDQPGVALDWVCGDHPLEILDGKDLVCVSGGVPLDLPIIQTAREAGIPLTNDSQIFLEAAPCKVIGITGSAGKTTTTILVGRMAVETTLAHGDELVYQKAWVGGNIGSPLVSLVDEMDPADIAVMELSSFQLELMTRSPQIAAVLNVTPNHLDRHGDMQAYLVAKSKILLNQAQKGIAVLGRDDPGAWSLRKLVKGELLSFGFSKLAEDEFGTYFEDGQIFVKQRDRTQPVLSVADIQLRGEHNLLNVMAACTLAIGAGFPLSAIKAGVQGFCGAPHRLEFVRRWGGADWYNDSIATAPERSMAAIRSFHDPLVLLAGGRDKNLPWQDFANLVSRRVRLLVLFGEAALIIQNALDEVSHGNLQMVRCAGLEEAVSMAAHAVLPGDVVLLSPGGTSYDEFKDFEERGRCFVQWVNDLP